MEKSFIDVLLLVHWNFKSLLISANAATQLALTTTSITQIPFLIMNE
jgi:hypothetical protein